MVTDDDCQPRPSATIVQQLSQDAVMDSGATPILPRSYLRNRCHLQAPPDSNNARNIPLPGGAGCIVCSHQVTSEAFHQQVSEMTVQPIHRANIIMSSVKAAQTKYTTRVELKAQTTQ